MAFGGEVPVGTLRMMMEQTRHDVAVAAAVGEWLSTPKSEVRSELADSWRNAILRHEDAEGLQGGASGSVSHWLKKIFEQHPDLAYEWAKKRLLATADHRFVRRDGVLAGAIRVLDAERRVELVANLEPSFMAGRYLVLLVGDSPDVYGSLLSIERLKDWHLSPLKGRPPSEQWTALARTALKFGYAPELLAEASCTPEFGMIISGSGVEHWGNWRDGFESLLLDSDDGVRRLAKKGVALANVLISKAAEEERRRQVTGVF